MKLFVVIPAYNEEAWLPATLMSLKDQSDPDFEIVLVDNNSTDNTQQVVDTFIAHHNELSIHKIVEHQKGTGAASDTGFRYAIANGATHIARTDADSTPDIHWVRNIKRAFKIRNLDFLAGKVKPREDEEPLSWFDRLAIPILLAIVEYLGKLRRFSLANQYPYLIVVGNNLAITAALYERAGGFPRTDIGQAHEDRELGERVRKLTPNAARIDDMVVYNSLRRLRAYGYLRTLSWYAMHRSGKSTIDVR